MSGKLCAVCLEKYVPAIFLRRLTDGCAESLICLCYRAVCVRLAIFSVALAEIISHNYKDKHDHGFTPACTPSAISERGGRQTSSSGDRYRSSLSRQRVLRPERFGAGQVRDAAQRSEGRSCGGRGGPGLWSVPPGLLCHSSIVPARGSAGIAATQARAETTRQAQRRSDGCPRRGYKRGWTDAQRRGVGGGFVSALWRRGASAQ